MFTGRVGMELLQSTVDFGRCVWQEAVGSFSDCTHCVLVGAILGALSAFMGCLLASALGWWQMTLQAIPVIQGKNYSHLATNEMVCDSSCDDSFGIVQCAAGALPHFFQSSKPRQSHLSTQQAQAAFVGSSPHSPSSQFAWLEKWNTESLLEPHLVLEASRFEEMWGRCSAGSRLLTATFATHGKPVVHVADKAEEALSRDGLSCIAAGMLGSMHKSYFAAQLRNSSDWFMLELVLHLDTAVAQVVCTFGRLVTTQA
uniref:Beta-adaptin appendage C-terminal subdomain domain-containing protein n=1 Tax=Prymnesium polylepis TaxID=72548 RepID=A0A7S4M224_9EUKA|mmetsp:Transcript_13550/g.34572  ORF Transcript_13550/g.34572 Transcript_13550/m.34572 type:complete len:257 (+) Transcript_13550:450-1220(+)